MILGLPPVGITNEEEFLIDGILNPYFSLATTVVFLWGDAGSDPQHIMKGEFIAGARVHLGVIRDTILDVLIRQVENPNFVSHIAVRGPERAPDAQVVAARLRAEFPRAEEPDIGYFPVPPLHDLTAHSTYFDFLVMRGSWDVTVIPIEEADRLARPVIGHSYRGSIGYPGAPPLEGG